MATGYISIARTSVAVLLSVFLLFQLTTAESNVVLWGNSTTGSSTPIMSEPTISSDVLSSTRSTTTPDDIGAFVAAGMGMSRPSSTSVISDTTSTSIIFRMTSDPISHTDLISNAPAVTAPPQGNYTLSFPSGDCWQQWSAYWAANVSAANAFTYVWTSATQTWIVTDISYSYSSSIISGSTTVTVRNGAHPQDTQTTVMQLSVSVTHTSTPTETRTTTTVRESQKRLNFFGNGTLIEPTCILPSYVPGCQEQWEDYIYHRYSPRTIEEPAGCSSDLWDDAQAPSCSAAVASFRSANLRANSLVGESPLCTQASVTGVPCSLLYEAFQSSRNYYGYNSGGVVGGYMNTTTYTTMTGTHTNDVATITSNVFFWDASTTLAPGCTLGCQSCQINGGTVQLIYWPPATSTWINGNYSAITPNATELITIETLGTTLTSPTVYVSFDSLYARDSCSFFGKTHYDQIVAITNTANLSSIHGWGLYNGLGSSALFNFTDLYVSPVPDYIYQSQPRCASSSSVIDSMNGRKDTVPGNWTCPRTADYDPILAIPLEVRELDPVWADCIGGIDGVYDPPIALKPVNSIALPTVPGMNPEQTSDAAPASTPKPTDPPNTSFLGDDKPSKTALLEEDPDSTSGSEVKLPSPDPGDEDPPSDENEEDLQETQRLAEPTNQPDQDDTKDDPTSSEPDQPQDEGVKQDDHPAQLKPSAPTNEGNEDSEDGQSVNNDPLSSQPDQPKKEGFVQDPSADPTQKANEGSGNNQPARTNGPLSILFSAIDSAKAAETGVAKNQDPSEFPTSSSQDTENSPDSDPAGENQSAASPQDPNYDSELEPSTDNASLTQNTPDPTVIALPGGGSATLHEASGSVVIEQEGLSAGAAQGSAATIGTHVYSAAPDGSAIVVDGVVAHAAPAPAIPTGNENDAAQVWTHAGETFSAIVSGSTIALQGPGLTSRMPAGAVATVAGVEISVPSSGGMLVHGKDTVTFEQSGANNKAGITATIFDHDGDEIVASPTGSKVIFQQGGSSITLAAGQETTFQSKIYSLAPSGRVLAADGSEILLPAAAVETAAAISNSAIPTLVHQSETFTASATGSDVVIQHGNRTFTVSSGQQTVVDGQTLSVAPNGRLVIVDGSETVSLPKAKTVEEDVTATLSGTSFGTTSAFASTSAADEVASETHPSEPSSTASETAADVATAKVASGLSVAVGIVSFLVIMLVV